MKGVLIGDRLIGEDTSVFIIAELSANHNQSLDLAHATIDAAAIAGADAIKLQTYLAETITLRSKKEFFLVKGGTAWDGEYLFELYEKAHTPWEWHKELFDHAKEVGLISFSSPFDPTAVRFLEDLEVPAFKIASFEITDLPLIEMVARTGKPIIISTGIARYEEIEAAVQLCRSVGNEQIVLLKCTSAYPTPLHELNLRTIPDLANRFKCLVGLSDHTTTHTAPQIAVALGASVIEKHLILGRTAGGPDSSFSLEPNEFAEMVRLVRDAESSLGKISYDLTPGALISRAHARSLFVVLDVKAGEQISQENVRSIRPADGLSPIEMSNILGKRFKRPISAGEPLDWEMFEG